MIAQLIKYTNECNAVNATGDVQYNDATAYDFEGCLSLFAARSVCVQESRAVEDVDDCPRDVL